MIEKVWKGIGRNQEEKMSSEKFGGYKAEEEERIKTREGLALRKKAESDKHLKIYGGLNENLLARPNGLSGSPETAISSR